MPHDFIRFPELTNSQMNLYYFTSPHKQIIEDFRAKVVKVIDGDTVRLVTSFRNFDFPMRLLGIDAPESYQPGGDIAKDFLEKLVLEKEVRLEKDQTDKDAYGRLLRYVYVSASTRFIGTPSRSWWMINAEIIRKSYAEVRFFPSDILYKKDFEEIQQTAFKNKKGLWAFLAFQAPYIQETEKIRETKSKKISTEKEVISWKEALKYSGKVKTVEGTVVATYNLGKACFLNFHQDWKNHFTAVIFSSDFAKFPSFPEDYYLNTKVWVTGLIKEYKGKPEIILKAPSQIEVIEV